MQAKLSKQSDQIRRKTPAWGKQKPDARIPVKDVCKDHVRKGPGGLLQVRKYRDRELFVPVGRSDGRGCRLDDDRRLSLIQNLHQRIGFPGPEAEPSAACQDPNGIRQRKRCRKAEVLRVLFSIACHLLTAALTRACAFHFLPAPQTPGERRESRTKRMPKVTIASFWRFMFQFGIGNPSGFSGQDLFRNL